MAATATEIASRVEQGIMPLTLDKRCARSALLESIAQETRCLVQLEIVPRVRIPQVELQPLLARPATLLVLVPRAGSVRQGGTLREDRLYRAVPRVLEVTLVAIAKRVVTPLVEQPTQSVTPLKLAPGLQSASAKPEDGRPGVRQASIA